MVSDFRNRATFAGGFFVRQEHLDHLLVRYPTLLANHPFRNRRPAGGRRRCLDDARCSMTSAPGKYVTEVSRIRRRVFRSAHRVGWYRK
jgi:hypothetical protein